MRSSKDLQAILDELAAIMVRKHQDYGPMNIAGAPGGPMNGLRVRMYDKLARLNNLVEKGDTPNYETIEDTFLDLANYAIIGLLVQRGQWEGLPNSNDDKTKASSSPLGLTNSLSQHENRTNSIKLHSRLQTR